MRIVENQKNFEIILDMNYTKYYLQMKNQKKKYQKQ